MTAPQWIRVCRVDDVPIREGRVVAIGGHEVAVFNTGSRFFAVESRCPHKNGPLADGIVTGDSVVCPLHAWKINLERGRVDRPAGEDVCVDRYDVRVEDGVVAIAWPARACDAKDGAAA